MKWVHQHTLNTNLYPSKTHCHSQQTTIQLTNSSTLTLVSTQNRNKCPVCSDHSSFQRGRVALALTFLPLNSKIHSSTSAKPINMKALQRLTRPRVIPSTRVLLKPRRREAHLTRVYHCSQLLQLATDPINQHHVRITKGGNSENKFKFLMRTGPGTLRMKAAPINPSRQNWV
jgi:hypothetical protein